MAYTTEQLFSPYCAMEIQFVRAASNEKGYLLENYMIPNKVNKHTLALQNEAYPDKIVNKFPYRKSKF